MKLIVAVDKNWGIGKNNDLLFHLPTDMKFFRQTTSEHVIVLGRKTLESFPNKQPLKNRINIVLTTDLSYECEGATLCYSKEEVFDELERFSTDEVFICGGEQIYRLFLEDCDTAYVTKIDAEADAEKFFPNLDEHPAWELTEASEPILENGVSFRFCTYQKKKGCASCTSCSDCASCSGCC